MYDFVVGQLAEKSPTKAVIDSGGVGYLFMISLNTFSALPEVGSSVKLMSHLNVREDDLSLFGFAEVKERAIFRLLISISGIGPRLALTILSGMGPDALAQTIQSRDVAMLTKIPGIGKKTAERLVVELKEKIPKTLSSQKSPGMSDSPGGLGEDAVAAMTSLGYKKPDAVRAIERVLAESKETSVEGVIREALNYVR